MLQRDSPESRCEADSALRGLLLDRRLPAEARFAAALPTMSGNNSRIEEFLQTLDGCKPRAAGWAGAASD